MMQLLNKVVFPVRRVWFAVSARFKARNNGAGLVKLRDDIQTCGYEDVQVMWEMLKRTESELMPHHPKRKHRPFRGIFIWSSNNGSSPSFASNPAQ